MTEILANFRDRFRASLPDVPADLDLHLDEFVLFEAQSLPGQLSAKDVALLITQGLPRDASPFLSFYVYSQSELASRKEIFGIPESFFPIGHNGSGDVLAIDLGSGEVVYFNHDNHNAKVLINSSLQQFVESLCIFQEHCTGRIIRRALPAIAAIDPAASQQGSMWPSEVRSAVSAEA